jgi:hypothetical protein
MSPPTSSALDLLYTARYSLLALFFGTLLLQQWLSYRRLSHFKGPVWASLTSLWLAGSVSRRRAHLDLYDVYLQYGPTQITPLSYLQC